MNNEETINEGNKEMVRLLTAPRYEKRVEEHLRAQEIQ
jgi:hypothetical protein